MIFSNMNVYDYYILFSSVLYECAGYIGTLCEH